MRLTNFTILAALSPPTSVAVKKLHVVRALGFCSRLIFPGFEKLKAHRLQPADSRSALSQQPVAMVTPGSVEGRCSSSEIYDTTPFAKHQRVLCCCHHKPAWCLLLAPPTATEIFSLPGIARWKRQKRLVCAYVRVGNFANGTVFTPPDHLQPNFSSLWHLYLWAVSPDGFQQEGSNDVVNVSLEGWIQILRGKKNQTVVEMEEIMQMFETESEVEMDKIRNLLKRSTRRLLMTQESLLTLYNTNTFLKFLVT